MNETVKSALRVYGEYLDNRQQRLDKTLIDAIRTIRTYAYERDPDDGGIQKAIVTAKTRKLTGAQLEALISEMK